MNGQQNIKYKSVFFIHHWGGLGVNGWIILRWISSKWDVGIWNELGWPKIETVGGIL